MRKLAFAPDKLFCKTTRENPIKALRIARKAESNWRMSVHGKDVLSLQGRSRVSEMKEFRKVFCFATSTLLSRWWMWSAMWSATQRLWIGFKAGDINHSDNRRLIGISRHMLLLRCGLQLSIHRTFISTRASKIMSRIALFDFQSSVLQFLSSAHLPNFSHVFAL